MTNRIAPMMLAALGMCFGAPAALGQASALGTAREAVERRAAWKKGAVTLTWDSPHWPDGTRFYTAQFTRGEKLLIWHGDAEGVLARDRDGRPRNWSSSPFGPLYTLDTDEATWMVQEMDVKADMYRRTSPQGSLDVRSLGLTAGVPLFDPEHTLDDLRKAAPAGTRDGLELYVADSEHGRVTWWLDPQKGGLPVRVTREYEGRVVAESRSTLEKIGGAWFPGQVEFFDAAYMEGKAPRQVIRVSDARFDASDLPDRIALEDIGVDAGINVHVYVQGQAGLEGAYKWDGRRPVTDEEYHALWAQGLRSGPVFQRNWKRLSILNAERTARHAAGQATAPLSDEARPSAGPLKPIADWESEWERYVREFCARYRLDAGQVSQADRLLDSCKKLGHEYLARRRFPLEAFERALAQFARLDPDEQVLRRPLLERQRLALILPLREIFDERLKPGLESSPRASSAGRRRRAANPDRPEASAARYGAGQVTS